MLKELILRTLNRVGYNLVRVGPTGPAEDAPDIPDAWAYQPLFVPWLCDDEFMAAFSVVAPTTIVSVDRCHLLWTLALQATRIEGEFFECGVYQGGTARLLAEALAPRADGRRLHLFDTFSGMPDTSEHDLHHRGDFADGLARVERFVGHPELVALHAGVIPETFAGLEDVRIAFAHIDVDIYQSIIDCCAFVYPRLEAGGAMVFDDYGFASCPGARKAVDEFFAGKPERPLVLANGQAVVIRLADR